METTSSNGVDWKIMNNADFLMVGCILHEFRTQPPTGLVGFKFHTLSTNNGLQGPEPHRSELNTTKGDTK